ncbi:hypothetical protein HOY80DRAFT_1141745 [Tuber brumale]|nr:hypothetical protein HOY80DRAFT_1141745 [Tuber brumale]
MTESILGNIATALAIHHDKLLVFDNLDPAVSRQILGTLFPGPGEKAYPGLRINFTSVSGHLKLIAPTLLHEAPCAWLQSELALWVLHHLLHEDTLGKLDIGAPTYRNFLGRFAGSTRNPDLAFTPLIKGIGRDYPSIILESGWGEDTIHLQTDSEIWQEGSAGAVKVAIFVKLFPTIHKNVVRVTLQLYRYLRGGAIKRIELNVFPIPYPPLEDPFITIDELFAGNVPQGLDPEAELPLNMERLRKRIGQKIVNEGNIPA